jgi:winged helix DNA-binding protein
VTVEVLSRRALNRATLERQLLLRRSTLPVVEAVGHLVGMQAQIPQNPYLGLFSRIERFRPQDLEALFLDRSVVRIVVMRGTIHLVTAEDAAELRPLTQPVLDAEIARHPDYGPALRGVNVAPALAFARKELAKEPMNGRELRTAMAKRFPKRDAAALAYACRCLLPLVQVPPRGLWGRSGEMRSTTLESWTGRTLTSRPSIDRVVLRYLAAFGPATVADIGSWSRLTGMREVVDRLKRKLRRLTDENGRELWDVPDAPRPDPETPAPVRFLPEYDNILLSHADRSRFFPETVTNHSIGLGRTINGTALHDGLVCATWRLESGVEKGTSVFVVDLFERLTKRATASITAEARRAARFLVPAATEYEVRLSPLR